MFRTIYRTQDGQIRTDLTTDDISAALQDSKGLLWLDCAQEPPEDCEPLLLNVFHFHPLAVEDALQETHVPKLDDWMDYVYMVMHAALLDMDADEPITIVELDIFLGKNYVVTHHERPMDAVDRVWTRSQRDPRRLKQGATHLMYEIADELVDDYMPVFESMDDVIEDMEDHILDNPTPETLERLLVLKRALLRVRRIIGPEREVLNKLARDPYTSIDAKSRVFFRDVYDHLVRLYDINDSMRDLLTGMLDTYLSVVNNRMNEVMKTLTVITTLFMPLSFLVGFFGMNFFEPVLHLPAWTGQIAFYLVLASMLVVPLGMYLWMRNRLL